MTIESNDRSASSETTSGAGLFLNMAAVIAVVICVGGLASSQFATVAIAGVFAVVSFAASLLCFAIDERRGAVQSA